MGGGLMQLVAYGAQDIYLTGNPQITFFKVVYRRHTNFSMESIKQTLNGSSSAVTAGQTATCTVSRNGDLVYKTYVTFTAVTGNTTGSNLISDVELEIGGQRIDRHYQEWNEIWNELSTPESKAMGLKAMQLEIGDGATTGVTEAQVPLNFWFCRNPGLALPLIALQYHEVKLKFTWGAVSGIGASPQVWCDYIYLDTDERRRFAQVSHEYLIEQVQRQALDDSGSVKLNFNHPVKELIWTSPDNGYDTARLVLNGHDRFADQKKEYFQLRQPYDYHTGIPRQNLPEQSLLDGLAQKDFLGHTAAHVYTAHDTPTSDTLCKLASLVLTWQGNAAPAITSLQVPAPLKIAITVITAGTVASGSANIGSVFFAECPDASACTVSTNNIEATLSAAPTDVHGNTITAIDTTNSGTYNIREVLSDIPTAPARTSQMTNKINVYSFALKPEEHQPSGTCNFSRIDNAKLEVASSTMDGTNMMYAVNYNVLRIMSGMGGLAYSN